jgi:F-type H+-transporting ATPase subunit gamma
MPRDLRTIRRKIRVVQNIEHITKAMQMVAAARLQRVQARVTQGRAYWDRLKRMMERVTPQAGQIEHPLLEVREPRRIGLLVIASDRGLCGSYNHNNLREADRFVAAAEQPVMVVTVGMRARQHARRRGWEVIEQFHQISEKTAFGEILQIARYLRQLYEDQEVDRLHVTYARYLSALRILPTTEQVLPLQMEEKGEVFGEVEYIFEPDAAELLGRLLPRYVDTFVYHVLLESQASEHAARMQAMTAASDNATDLLERLTLERNRARQEAITSEMMTIATGAEALSQS